MPRKNVCPEHKCLLFHTDVRWFSRGNWTRWVFELRHELFTLFKKKNYEFKDDLENDEFISRLVYLSDIFQAYKSFVPRIDQQHCNFYFKAGSIYSQARCLDQKCRANSLECFNFLPCFQSSPMINSHKKLRIISSCS